MPDQPVYAFINPSSAVATQRQYRIIFLDGAFVDFSPNLEFNFVQFILNCRSMGYMLSDNAYVRWDLVRCVLMWNDGNPPAVPTPIISPTTETKQ